MNNDLCLLINTATNIFCLLPIKELYQQRSYLGMSLFIITLFNSIMMHLGERKHGLIPFIEYFTPHNSELWLNLDKITAVMAFIYCYYIWHINIYPSRNTILTLAITGMLCLRLGEITHDLTIYTMLHTLWHFSAFSAAFLVFSHNNKWKH